MTVRRGHIVRTPGGAKPYKVVLVHERGEESEYPVSSMREGEALIKEAAPRPPRRDTSRDTPARPVPIDAE